MIIALASDQRDEPVHIVAVYSLPADLVEQIREAGDTLQTLKNSQQRELVFPLPSRNRDWLDVYDAEGTAPGENSEEAEDRLFNLVEDIQDIQYNILQTDDRDPIDLVENRLSAAYEEGVNAAVSLMDGDTFLTFIVETKHGVTRTFPIPVEELTG
jgi:hypothetical protein